jgi:hypothetical protein
MRSKVLHGYLEKKRGFRELGTETGTRTVESVLRSIGAHVDDLVFVEVRQGKKSALIEGTITISGHRRQICYYSDSLKGLTELDCEKSVEYTIHTLGGRTGSADVRYLRWLYKDFDMANPFNPEQLSQSPSLN